MENKQRKMTEFMSPRSLETKQANMESTSAIQLEPEVERQETPMPVSFRSFCQYTNLKDIIPYHRKQQNSTKKEILRSAYFKYYKQCHLRSQPPLSQLRINENTPKHVYQHIYNVPREFRNDNFECYYFLGIIEKTDEDLKFPVSFQYFRNKIEMNKVIISIIESITQYDGNVAFDALFEDKTLCQKIESNFYNAYYLYASKVRNLFPIEFVKSVSPNVKAIIQSLPTNSAQPEEIIQVETTLPDDDYWNNDCPLIFKEDHVEEDMPLPFADFWNYTNVRDVVITHYGSKENGNIIANDEYTVMSYARWTYFIYFTSYSHRSKSPYSLLRIKENCPMELYKKMYCLSAKHYVNRPNIYTLIGECSENNSTLIFPVSFEEFEAKVATKRMITEIFEKITQNDGRLAYDALCSDRELLKRATYNLYIAFYTQPKDFRPKIKLILKAAPEFLKQKWLKDLLQKPSAATNTSQNNSAEVTAIDRTADINENLEETENLQSSPTCSNARLTNKRKIVDDSNEVSQRKKTRRESHKNNNSNTMNDISGNENLSAKTSPEDHNYYVTQELTTESSACLTAETTNKLDITRFPVTFETFVQKTNIQEIVRKICNDDGIVDKLSYELYIKFYNEPASRSNDIFKDLMVNVWEVDLITMLPREESTEVDNDTDCENQGVQDDLLEEEGKSTCGDIDGIVRPEGVVQNYSFLHIGEVMNEEFWMRYIEARINDTAKCQKVLERIKQLGFISSTPSSISELIENKPIEIVSIQELPNFNTIIRPKTRDQQVQPSVEKKQIQEQQEDESRSLELTIDKSNLETAESESCHETSNEQITIVETEKEHKKNQTVDEKMNAEKCNEQNIVIENPEVDADYKVRYEEARKEFFKPVHVRQLLSYRIRTEHFLKRGITNKISNISFEDFQRYIKIYKLPEINKNVETLKEFYAILKKNIWPSNLYFTLNDFISYILEKKFKIRKLNFSDISPIFLHWSDLKDCTNYDECVKKAYNDRYNSIITNMNELELQREQHFKNCWRKDSWIGYKPVVTDALILEKIKEIESLYDSGSVDQSNNDNIKKGENSHTANVTADKLANVAETPKIITYVATITKEKEIPFDEKLNITNVKDAATKDDRLRELPEKGPTRNCTRLRDVEFSKTNNNIFVDRLPKRTRRKSSLAEKNERFMQQILDDTPSTSLEARKNLEAINNVQMTLSAVQNLQQLSVVENQSNLNEQQSPNVFPSSSDTAEETNSFIAMQSTEQQIHSLPDDENSELINSINPLENTTELSMRSNAAINSDAKNDSTKQIAAMQIKKEPLDKLYFDLNDATGSYTCIQIKDEPVVVEDDDATNLLDIVTDTTPPANLTNVTHSQISLCSITEEGQNMTLFDQIPLQSIINTNPSNQNILKDNQMFPTANTEENVNNQMLSQIDQPPANRNIQILPPMVQIPANENNFINNQINISMVEVPAKNINQSMAQTPQMPANENNFINYQISPQTVKIPVSTKNLYYGLAGRFSSVNAQVVFNIVKNDEVNNIGDGIPTTSANAALTQISKALFQNTHRKCNNATKKCSKANQQKSNQIESEVPQKTHDFRALPLKIAQFQKVYFAREAKSSRRISKSEELAKSITASQALADDSSLFNNTQLQQAVAQINDPPQESNNKVNVNTERDNDECDNNIESECLTENFIFSQIYHFHYFKKLTRDNIKEYNLPKSNLGKTYYSAQIFFGKQRKVSGTNILEFILPNCCSTEVLNALKVVLNSFDEFHFNFFDSIKNAPDNMAKNQELCHRLVNAFFFYLPGFKNICLQYNKHTRKYNFVSHALTNNKMQKIVSESLAAVIDPAILQKMSEARKNLCQ